MVSKDTYAVDQVCRLFFPVKKYPYTYVHLYIGHITATNILALVFLLLLFPSMRTTHTHSPAFVSLLFIYLFMQSVRLSGRGRALVTPLCWGRSAYHSPTHQLMYYATPTQLWTVDLPPAPPVTAQCDPGLLAA